jgi:hypothetical protein
MVDYLIERKVEIVNQHMQRIIEANQKILETIVSVLKDKEVDAKVKLQITKLLELTTGGGGGSTTGMESQDKLELAKGFLNNADSIMQTVRNESGYQSLVKNIDEQLEVYRGEIETIDQELNVVEDKDKRKELWRQREKAGQKSA